MKPTPEQLSTFREQGFVQVPGALSAERVFSLAEAFEAMVGRLAVEAEAEPEHYRRVISQWTSVWDHEAAFREQLMDVRLGEFAAGLLGCPAVQLLHDQVISKEPGDSSAVPWHQDIGYWPVSGPLGVSAWIALDDATPDSGCMHYMPGSHQERVEPPMDFLQSSKQWGVRETQVMAPCVRAGDVIFHDCRTWHTTPPNQTQGPRRAYIVIYLDARLSYTPNNARWAPINRRIKVQPGHRLNEDNFPMLWRQP